ncbi:hypothetical protein KBD45_02770 [Candidatus Dojkabacteria bacterium]|nr:hypothetical protein [Candidatus Dojkabacteria bacterium]
MKHQVKKMKFGHSKSQRVAIIKNLARDLVLYGHLKTTKTRAKAIVPYMEKMITFVKKNDASDNSNNYIIARISDKQAAEKLRELTKKRYVDINSGFVSIYNLGNRKGDGAEMCEVIMKGYEPKIKSALKKVKKTTVKKAAVKNEKKAEVKKETKIKKEDKKD